MATGSTAVLLAGGGTGGHIYPNVAIQERLAERGHHKVHFLVSDRPGDAQTMTRLGLPFTASPIRPLPSLRTAHKTPGFLWSWRQAVSGAMRLIRREHIGAVVMTGGFVSGPAMVAATRLGIPRALVNLDAIPGVANRQLARLASHVYSSYRTAMLPQAERIGLPLRKVSIGPAEPGRARQELGLQPDLPTLFVTGATHGAESVIRTMMALVGVPERSRELEGWQVFHQCGTFDPAELQRAYDRAGVRAKVVDYCDAMGLAYAAADLVISRAGAGSVAEAWSNAAPTIFLPNPYHKDQHQRHNAVPLVDAGGALMIEDVVDPSKNVTRLAPVLFELMRDPERRRAMREALQRSQPPDGASVVADWLLWALASS